MYRFKEFVAACLVTCLGMVVVLTAPALAQEKKPKPQILCERPMLVSVQLV